MESLLKAIRRNWHIMPAEVRDAVECMGEKQSPERHPMTPNVMEFKSVSGADMTDRRNWLPGDWLAWVSSDDRHYKHGAVYQMKADGTIGDHGASALLCGNCFKFHARPDADGWIKWEGGDCPVPATLIVTYRMRDGERAIRRAGALRWGCDGGAGDIIAYRPHCPSLYAPSLKTE